MQVQQFLRKEILH